MSFTYYLLAFLLISSISSAPQEDLVNLSKIPAKYNISYKGPIYSGFLPSTSSNRLHYVFVPSESSPASSPVVLWLNGGPGCSSMEGFVNENGPFFFKDWSTETVLNNYSWNKIANMLYIESPSQLGFSTGQANHDDSEVAKENIAALVSFFNKFPEYKRNKFFISGESYAGVYIPFLTNEVINYNSNPKSAFKINIDGILIGNGVTHPDFDLESAFIDFAFQHGLYTVSKRREIESSCGKKAPYNLDNPECNKLANELYNLIGNTNPYDIYRNCYPDDKTLITDETIELNKKYVSRKDVRRFLNKLKNKKNQGSNTEFNENNLKDDPPCADVVGITDFFNNKDVQNAFHVPNISFSICSDIDYSPSEKFSFFLYDTIIKNKIRILKYSGDTDAVVPFTGTRAWIEVLNLPVIEKYRPWHANKEVSGFVERFNGLTFATVKGTGHMVPGWKREEAFHMFERFLSNSEF